MKQTQRKNSCRSNEPPKCEYAENKYLNPIRQEIAKFNIY